VDVGAGPGYAALDLAEIVGPGGVVLAVERSARFLETLRRERDARGLSQLELLEADLMESTPPGGFDLAWCRWVASFAASVPTLVKWIRGALRPGGIVVFHEYVDYGSWQFLPARPRLKEFVAEVMASWRASGGEPDVAPLVVEALRAEAFTVESTRPLVFATKPGELTWQWPAGFVAINAHRLRELGRVSSDWVEEVLKELSAAEADPASVMVTPLVLEIIARRPPR
jgi:SAM-dependent methyltransferase